MSLFLFALAMLADPLSDPCRDDDGKDRCSAALQAEMRALYRVPPIESYDNAIVRRVFFVDGYGNDTVAIEFIRAAEKDPVLRVRSPHAKDENPAAPLEQLLTVEQWEQVLEASKNFDRQYAAPSNSKDTPAAAGEEGEEITLCIHSWVYWAEAIDVGVKRRSTVNDACNDQPVEQFAWFAAKLAVRAIPFCDALDARLSRNEATLLRACSYLTGDRIAAAEVWNEAEDFRFVDRPQFRGIDDLVAREFELDLQGKKTKNDSARSLWRSLVTQKDAPRFFYDRIHGLNADTVIVPGGLIKELSDGKSYLADVEMRWEREGGTMALKSIKVGPYRPHTFTTE